MIVIRVDSYLLVLVTTEKQDHQEKRIGDSFYIMHIIIGTEESIIQSFQQRSKLLCARIFIIVFECVKDKNTCTCILDFRRERFL